jgi:hypothetical protein
MLPPRWRWAIALYDHAYRVCHRLDAPDARIGAALRLEIRRARRGLVLADGTVVAAGDRIGVLHMNNERVRTLHLNGDDPMMIGLLFRRELVASLRDLAMLASPGQRAADVMAFSAITILHHGLPRLGFERDPTPPACPYLIAAYQRALIATLHPAGAGRLLRLANARAERLWISAARLRALYGAASRIA